VAILGDRAGWYFPGLFGWEAVGDVTSFLGIISKTFVVCFISIPSILLAEFLGEVTGILTFEGKFVLDCEFVKGLFGGEVKLVLFCWGDFYLLALSDVFLGDLIGELFLYIWMSKIYFVSVYFILLTGWYWYVFWFTSGDFLSSVFPTLFPELTLLGIDFPVYIFEETNV